MICSSSSSKLTEASYSPKKVWELWDGCWRPQMVLPFWSRESKLLQRENFQGRRCSWEKIYSTILKYSVHFTHSWDLAFHLALSVHIYHWTCFPGKTSPVWRTPGTSWVWAPPSRSSPGWSQSTMRQVGEVVFHQSSVHTELIKAKVRDPYLAHW